MKLKQGMITREIASQYDVLLFTANSTTNNQGELVMGAGFAKCVKDWFPDMPDKIGYVITTSSGPDYGLAYAPTNVKNPFLVMAFQVKHSFWKPASLALISTSANMLTSYASLNRDLKMCLNFPGVGAGKLSVDQVLPLLKNVPDNVDIWLSEDKYRWM